MRNNTISLMFLLLSMILAVAFSASMTQRNLLQGRLLETEDEIIAQIDAKIAEKAQAVTERDQINADLMTNIDEAKNISLSLLDAKFAVEASYRNYFNEKKKCDGYNAVLNIVGERGAISDDECLEFPIATEAVQLYVQKSQLEGYQVDATYAKKAYDIQAEWVNDASLLNDVYQNLKSFFAGKNAELQNHFSIKAFNSQNFVYQERQKRDQYKIISDGAANTASATAAQVQTSENGLASKKAACATNLPGLKSDLDAKLSVVYNLQNSLNTKNSLISSGFDELAAKLSELQGLTTDLSNLADEYATIAATI